MSADVPDYPPGPRGPEDAEPGPRVTLTAEQARFLGRYIEQLDRASAVQIEERGAGYSELTVFDPEGAVIEERLVFPTGNQL